MALVTLVFELAVGPIDFEACFVVVEGGLFVEGDLSMALSAGHLRKLWHELIFVHVGVARLTIA